MKKLVALLLACMLILAAVAAMAEPRGTVMLYSSLKEKQLVAIKEAFEAKYPGIVMDYYQAGTGKIKTKIATEQQAGQVAADLLWVGDASDYLTFKEQGILEAYVSPESEKVPEAYKDSDDLYCGARLVVMGMAYNTQNVTEEEAPKHWKDLLNETFRDQIIMTDPTESGTTAYLVGALVNNEAYGWEFFEQLAAMGTELDSGTSGTHNNVASGGYKVASPWTTSPRRWKARALRSSLSTQPRIPSPSPARLRWSRAAQTPTTANCCMTSSCPKRVRPC